MSAVTDRITAALVGFHVDPSPAVCGCYELTPEDATLVAERVAEALQLKEEWGVQITEDGRTVVETHPGTGEPMDRETAFYENERWSGYGYNTEGVRSRWVSKWETV